MYRLLFKMDYVRIWMSNLFNLIYCILINLYSWILMTWHKYESPTLILISWTIIRKNIFIKLSSLAFHLFVTKHMHITFSHKFSHKQVKASFRKICLSLSIYIYINTHKPFSPWEIYHDFIMHAIIKQNGNPKFKIITQPSPYLFLLLLLSYLCMTLEVPYKQEEIREVE